MSPSTDRSQDASPFAWIFGLALAFVAAGGITRAVMDRRAGRAARPASGSRRRGSRVATPADGSEDASLAGHPS